jgi:TolB-like protein/Tfp pilus assembly protein PilF
VTDGPQDGEQNSVWNRLRRRKVVQWTLAYAAGAWGLLQGLQFVVDAFEWPNRVLKLGTVAALVGLPLVVAIAWFRGERGAQRVTRKELAVVTLLFLLGGGLFWHYQRSTPATESSGAAETPATPAAAEPLADVGPSIAVLPFDNRSAKEEDAFFVDGIHDDILTQLSKIGALKVISRTSVEQFRDTKLPIKEIAQQLGVNSILEGGVQRGGDRVRINVQLIDAATDAHLWAETYDRKLTATEIFAIQSELAESIAGALKAKLTEGEKGRVDAVPTENLAAWEAYQLGRQRLAKRTSDSLADAERYFREATELDPGFAHAYAGLGDALRLQIDYGGKPAEATLVAAEGAIVRALELDPELAEAWASKGGIAMSRVQWGEARDLLRRAIELNPNYATAHQWLSLALRGSDQPNEMRHAERAAELDPLSVIVRKNLCDSLQTVSRFDEAAECLERVIEIDPSSPLAYGGLGWLDAYARNRFADAVGLMQQAAALDAGNPEFDVNLTAIYLDLGDAPRARQLVASLVERWPDGYYANVAAAVIEQLLGSRAAAERHARKALAEYPQDMFSMRILRDADLHAGGSKAAKERYVRAFPGFLGQTPPVVDEVNFTHAIDLALVLQMYGETEPAARLLEASERVIRRNSRLAGYGITDVQIHALRGDKAKALSALREAVEAGWRGPLWRYYRDIDPNLASIREEPEFKAVFADVERDMARQRAELAKRPEDSPLDLNPSR